MDKKIINRPENVIPELIEGFIAAQPRYYEKVPNANGVLLKPRRRGKVSMVVGGGSGHEPLFTGFVGKGLADAAACGNIFASPDPGTICEVARAVDSAQGILFLYGNYAGDNLNFDMAEEFLRDEGIQTAHYRVKDDCGSAPPERRDDRRGIAGDVFAMKIAGAACDAGLTLEEVLAVCNRLDTQLCSIGMATSPGQIPGAEKPTFEIGPDEIEFGIGVHGEPGIQRTAMQPADTLTEVLYDRIVRDMPIGRGDEVCVLINGMGSTTVLEMSIVFRKLRQLLMRDGVEIYDSIVNSYCTCMEMGGFSISILKLDEQLKAFYNAACFSPFFAREEIR